MADQRPAGGGIRLHPGRGGREIVRHRLRRAIDVVGSAAERFVFAQAHITGAAAGGGRGGCGGGLKRFAAAGGKCCLQDIGGAVQVALAVTANQFQIARKSHVALHQTCAHLCSGAITFGGVFGVP